MNSSKKNRREEILREWGGTELLPSSFVVAEAPFGSVKESRSSSGELKVSTSAVLSAGRASSRDVRVASQLVGGNDGLKLASIGRVQKVAGYLATIRASYEKTEKSVAKPTRARKNG